MNGVHAVNKRLCVTITISDELRMATAALNRWVELESSDLDCDWYFTCQAYNYVFELINYTSSCARVSC